MSLKFNSKKYASALVLTSLMVTPVLPNYLLHSHSVLAEEVVKEEAKKAEQLQETEKVLEDSSNQGDQLNISSIVKKESMVISDSSVFYLKIGYEFEDGSFDEWAKGTAFLVNNQDLITTKSLADTSTSSALYKAILEKKSDAYKKAGIDLKDEVLVEKSFVIKVYNTDGEIQTIKGSAVKNGVGLITLDKTTTSKPAIFAEEEDVVSDEGARYKMKLASLSGDKASISEVEGSLTAPDTNAVSGTLSYLADTSLGDVIGSPVYNADGYIIGMVSAEGTSLTVIPTNAIQSFLSDNAVPFEARIAAEKRIEKEKKEKAEQELLEISKSTVSTKKLDSLIKKVETLNKTLYKEDGFEQLQEVLKEAKKVVKHEDKTQSEVDSAYKKLDKAYKSLEEYTLMDKLLLPVAIGTGILVVSASLVFAFIKVKRNRVKPPLKSNKISSPHQTELDNLSLLQEMDAADLRQSAKVSQQRQMPTLQKKNEQGVYEALNSGLDVTQQVVPSALRTGNTNIPGVQFAEEKSDQVVNLANEKYGVYSHDHDYTDEGDDETTILGKTAYLFRKDIHKQIPIFNDFVIGKELKSVNYRIEGNSNVSRTHARFKIINGDYHVEDLSSTNFTYLNGNQLPAYKLAKLTNGDVIKMADVEFTFYQ